MTMTFRVQKSYERHTEMPTVNTKCIHQTQYCRWFLGEGVMCEQYFLVGYRGQKTKVRIRRQFVSYRLLRLRLFDTCAKTDPYPSRTPFGVPAFRRTDAIRGPSLPSIRKKMSDRQKSTNIFGSFVRASGATKSSIFRRRRLNVFFWFASTRERRTSDDCKSVNDIDFQT